MSRVKHILVPTDFSDASKAALEYACGLADAVGGSLHVLHTLEDPAALSGYTEYYSLPQDYFDVVEEQARDFLESALTPAQKERYQATLVLRRGSAAQEILQYLAEHDDIDLVVMATHGRGGVARFMVGSVADKVVRAARCPVLTIRHGGEESTKTSRAA